MRFPSRRPSLPSFLWLSIVFLHSCAASDPPSRPEPSPNPSTTVTEIPQISKTIIHSAHVSALQSIIPPFLSSIHLRDPYRTISAKLATITALPYPRALKQDPAQDLSVEGFSEFAAHLNALARSDPPLVDALGPDVARAMARLAWEEIGLVRGMLGEVPWVRRDEAWSEWGRVYEEGEEKRQDEELARRVEIERSLGGFVREESEGEG